MPLERLPLKPGSEEIMGVEIRKVSIPVAAGRNLAVLTEAAARAHILRAKGVDPAAAFMARHSHFLERSMP
jgi:HPr kinase/phosphorylase